MVELRENDKLLKDSNFLAATLPAFSRQITVAKFSSLQPGSKGEF
jgi:hypothetical protein